jgi:hypothetical protein
MDFPRSPRIGIDFITPLVFFITIAQDSGLRQRAVAAGPECRFLTLDF